MTNEQKVAGSSSVATWKSPSWIARCVSGVCLLTIVGVRVFSTQLQAAIPAIDPAVVTLTTLALGFLACMSLLSWFAFWSNYSRAVRGLVVACLLAIVIVGAAAVRIQGVDGNMVPTLTWRWSLPKDATLAAVEGPSGAMAIDVTTTTPDDFPQFLGPTRNAYLSEPKLDRDWQAHPPKLLWKQPIGAGWSAFAVVNGYAFTLEQRGPEEWVTCYEVETGKLVWGQAVEARHETTLGGVGPRSTPTVHDGRVFALGGTGVLRCFDAATGQVVWQDDVVARGGSTPAEDLSQVAWGRASSPLIVDELVIVAGGGAPEARRSLIAYRQADGTVSWQKGSEQVSYASPALTTLAGRRQILTVNEDTVAGHDAVTGDELWTFPWPGHSNSNASASQAVPVGDDRVFISKGYGGGAAVFQIAFDGERGSATQVWASPRVLKTKFTNVTIIDEYVFGLSDGVLECVEVATGKSQWKKGRYGNGQLLGVGKLLLVLSEKGELALVNGSPEKYEELGRVEALDGQTWNNLCLSGRRLLVRNGEQAACYELAVDGDGGK